MKTKIANALSVFFMAVCAVLLAVLTVRRNPPDAGAISREKGEVRRTPVVRAIELVMPSVVNLSARRIFEPDALGSSGNTLSASAVPEGKSGISIGSGSIVDSSGLILTNAHVVHRAVEIEATLSSGATFSARVLAEDPLNDIALLKLEDPPVFLSEIPMASAGGLLLGETVIAVGNPFGLDGTITVGVLSGINRSLANGSRLLFTDLLQTDAAVFPGNSGGPLINLSGRMIGMNMAVRRNAPGIGFAIPLVRIENVLAGFLLPERFGELNFGIQPEMGKDGSVRVGRVFAGSPAESAGVKPGMLIRAFPGWEKDSSLIGLSRALIRLKPGEAVRADFSGLGPVRITPVPFAENDGALLAELKLGIGIGKLSPETAAELGYPVGSGVIVTAPDAGGVFRRGDVILRVKSEYVHDAAELARALRNLRTGETAPVVVLSPGSDPAHGRCLLRKTLYAGIR